MSQQSDTLRQGWDDIGRRDVAAENYTGGVRPRKTDVPRSDGDEVLGHGDDLLGVRNLCGPTHP